jgi:hypothetical protein
MWCVMHTVKWCADTQQHNITLQKFTLYAIALTFSMTFCSIFLLLGPVMQISSRKSREALNHFVLALFKFLHTFPS